MRMVVVIGLTALVVICAAGMVGFFSRMFRI